MIFFLNPVFTVFKRTIKFLESLNLEYSKNYSDIVNIWKDDDTSGQ